MNRTAEHAEKITSLYKIEDKVIFPFKYMHDLLGEIVEVIGIDTYRVQWYGTINKNGEDSYEIRENFIAEPSYHSEEEIYHINELY